MNGSSLPSESLFSHVRRRRPRGKLRENAGGLQTKTWVAESQKKAAEVAFRIARAPNRCKLVRVKTSVNLDDETASELARTVSLVREDTATVLRMAIRAGLPVIAGRFQEPRPDGYFAEDYEDVRPEQAKLEGGFSRLKISPDR
jgi:hypothetical protein